MESLQGRVGVVTGGASGIGRALAEALAREGAKVVVADLDEAGMAGVLAGIRGRGGEALAVRTDVGDLASVRALADRVFEAFGRVHVLCNNAGVALWGGLEAATHRDWQWALTVNLWGVMKVLHVFSGVQLDDPRQSRDWALTTVWAYSMDAVAAGLIFMVLSSLYMWWELPQKRLLGAVVLGLGSLICGLFCIGLRWLF